MRVDDLNYELPPDLIAQTPAERRDAARLMVVSRVGTRVEHRLVSDLPAILVAGDLLVLNDTRVIPARFYGRRADTGGAIEGLYLGSTDEQVWHIMLKAGGRLAVGQTLALDKDHHLVLIDKQADGSWLARRQGPLPTHELLDSIGVMPLPPYIHRNRADQPGYAVLDRQRYQTVYARQPGAVAAPTAGLHFTPQLLEGLAATGVQMASLTLHVGAGTFAPVRSRTLEEHLMHSEHFMVPAATLRLLAEARRSGRRIIPIGTTSVRALESLPEELDLDSDFHADTRLLIQPGFRFRFTCGLMTNFHLPRSTLLALVAAVVGLDRLKELYQIAIRERYRFYSYGDAMLILPD